MHDEIEAEIAYRIRKMFGRRPRRLAQRSGFDQSEAVLDDAEPASTIEGETRSDDLPSGMGQG